MAAGFIRRLGWILAGVLAGPAVLAHPVHTSVAEADYNRSTRTLEIAVRVFADDFEAALSARARGKISLENTPPAQLDAVIRAYVMESFTVKTSDGKPVACRWIGRELKDQANELWLYFEAALPGGIDGTRLRHALLIEQFSDQLNSIRVNDGTRTLTLLFFPDRGEKIVPRAP